MLYSIDISVIFNAERNLCTKDFLDIQLDEAIYHSEI